MKSLLVAIAAGAIIGTGSMLEASSVKIKVVKIKVLFAPSAYQYLRDMKHTNGTLGSMEVVAYWHSDMSGKEKVYQVVQLSYPTKGLTGPYSWIYNGNQVSRCYSECFLTSPTYGDDWHLAMIKVSNINRGSNVMNPIIQSIPPQFRDAREIIARIGVVDNKLQLSLECEKSGCHPNPMK